MINLKLTDDGDIDLSNGYITWIDGNESVLQHIKTRLAFSLGQFSIHPNAGTPYLQSILGKKNKNIASGVLKDIIIETPDVKEITEFDYTFNSQSRELEINIVLKTEFGDLTDNMIFSI